MLFFILFLLLFFVGKSRLNHDRTLDTLFLHLASDLISIGNGSVEVVGIGCAAAATVESYKAVSALFFA